VKYESKHIAELLYQSSRDLSTLTALHSQCQNTQLNGLTHTVASLGVERGDRPGDTIQGVTPD